MKVAVGRTRMLSRVRVNGTGEEKNEFYQNNSKPATKKVMMRNSLSLIIYRATRHWSKLILKLIYTERDKVNFPFDSSSHSFWDLILDCFSHFYAIGVAFASKR